MIDFFEYSELCEKLTKWAEAYSIGDPLVEDHIYDEEYKKLKQFEKANPDLIEKNSPTQKVIDASPKTSTFQKVEHSAPMISIANSNSHEELTEFCNAKKSSGCNQTVIEFKIDGLALALRYENGNLVDAITRGNGEEGDCVLGNALQINVIPKKISNKDNIEIRGEAVWLKEDFNKYNEKLELLGKDPISNPRNGAAGSMKQKDPQEVKDRNLSFVAYSFIKGSQETLQSKDLDYLQKEGFITSEYFICNSTEEVIDNAIKMEKRRNSLPYLIDGLVIKVNDKTTYKRLGGTSKTPHYCTALKFPPEEKVTKLLYIEESYGRSGAVTPVAIVEEVELSLTKVNRCSLHNWDMAEYLGLYEGCSVVIRKAGEIIPEITKVDGMNRSKDDYEKNKDVINLEQYRNHLIKQYPNYKFYNRPTVCEHCQTTLENDNNRSGDVLVSWVCKNPDCPVKQFEQIVKFSSKKAMDISGISESVIEKLLSKGYIKNITDLYKVTRDQLLTLDNFKDRSADKFLIAIKESEKAYMHQLLAGLGVKGLGSTASKILAEAFGDLRSFCNTSLNELTSIDGIGDELAQNIIEYFSNQENRNIVEWFIANNIGVSAKPVKKTTNKLEGLTLIMTGKSDKVGRDEFKALVAEHGGSLSSSISKNVSLVLLGDNAGPVKVKKIDALQKEGYPIKTISDVEFLKMVS